MTNVFIDGAQGTTGLKIFDRLKARTDITLITLPEERRKDAAARKEALNAADIAFLCLPDAAAREAVGLIENKKTVVLDTSTAHRTEKIGRTASRSFRRIWNKSCFPLTASPCRAATQAALSRL